MKNILLAVLVLTTSLSANAWVSDNQAASKLIKENAIASYLNVVNAKEESWAIKRASDIAKAIEDYGGRYDGVKLNILELSRDEAGSKNSEGTEVGFDITYKFLIYEQTIASVHTEIMTEALSSAIVTCQVAAVQSNETGTVKIEDQKCIVKPSALGTEASNE